MIELLKFYKRTSKNKRSYYEATLGTAHLFLFRNFDKRSEDDHDLTLYVVPIKKAKAEDGKK